MISNQILQKTVDGMHQITHMDFSVFDTEGGVLASTGTDAKAHRKTVEDFCASSEESTLVMGNYFCKVSDEGHVEYILMASGDASDVTTMGKVAAFQIQELLVAYRERFDKDNFIKNLLLDNLLLVDIYSRLWRWLPAEWFWW